MLTKRAFDFILSVLLLSLSSLFILVISILIKLTSRGKVVFWQKRIGQVNETFYMPKFRTMREGTPDVASHLLTNPQQYVTLIGRFLRFYSLDELPQLYSILIGQMSFVGPRPALYNQHELIKLREKDSIHLLKPGITGWAQVNGRDELSIKEKVSFDLEYLEKKSFLFDIYIIWLTFKKVLFREGISH